MKPGEEDFVKAEKMIEYLKKTTNYEIRYEKTDWKMVAYVDASHGATEDGKGITGFVLILSNGPISWSSKKQRLTTLSSAEAEYVALSDVTQEIIWIRNFLEELKHPLEAATVVYEDNQAAIALAHNTIINQRTKHIAIKYHFVRDHVSGKIIKLEYINTGSNLADGFTKNIGQKKLSMFCSKMGLVDKGCVRMVN